MRTPCSGRSLLIVALGIGALSGCSILGPEEACTLRGCASGLTVQLTSLPAEPYSVEVLAPGTGPQQVLAAYECDGGSSCLQEITFLRGAYGASPPTLRPVRRAGAGNGPRGIGLGTAAKAGGSYTPDPKGTAPAPDSTTRRGRKKPVGFDGPQSPPFRFGSDLTNTIRARGHKCRIKRPHIRPYLT